MAMARFGHHAGWGDRSLNMCLLIIQELLCQQSVRLEPIPRFNWTRRSSRSLRRRGRCSRRSKLEVDELPPTEIAEQYRQIKRRRVDGVSHGARQPWDDQQVVVGR